MNDPPSSGEIGGITIGGGSGGGVYHHEITVTNNSANTATGITIAHTDNRTGETLTLVSGNGSYDIPSQTWTLPSLGAGLTETLLLRVDAPRSNDATIDHTASITAIDQTDTDTGNNAVSGSITYTENSVTLSFTPYGGPTPAENDTFTRQVVIANYLDGNLTNLTVSIPVPANTTFVSFIASTGTYSGGTWTIPTINAAGAPFVTPTTIQVDITYSANVGSAGTTVTHTATITALDQPDGVPGDNSASDTTAIAP